jgi:hypothetical protein
MISHIVIDEGAPSTQPDIVSFDIKSHKAAMADNKYLHGLI